MSAKPRPTAREALEDLLERYVRAVDDRRLDEMTHVFTPDCRVRFGGVHIEGRDALLSHLRENLASFRETRHVIGNVSARSSGNDPATPMFRADVTAWHDFGGDRPTLTLHGFYDDTLAWTERGWRIVVHEGGENSREYGAERPVRANPTLEAR